MRHFRAAVVVVVVLGAVIPTVLAGPPPVGSPMRMVVIDPGHGGAETGVRGPAGTREKDVTLQLARLLSGRLAGKYRTKLSRTDDYHLDVFSRTNLANQEAADVFVSLHTAGSFQHRKSGFSLYYHKGAGRRVFGGDLSENQAFHLTDPSEPWRGAQRKHVPESRRMARAIQGPLSQFTGTPGTAEGASLLVLAGADRPAVLVEVGCLSNPAEEKKLGQTDYLAGIAEAISTGIINFFDHESAISSMDLHQ